ncbi:alpha-galactosidase a precursor [Fusarium avenaceum]|nr:alpha-galactosidase a precursor [Fusarium avenaceum]
MEDHVPELQLLQASIDADGESEFRILVDKRFIKYLTIDAGLFEIDEMAFGPTLFSLLPEFPDKDWNKGRISKDPVTGAVCFSAASRAHLPGVVSIWNTTHIDHLDLQMSQKLRSNVYEATSSRFNSPVIAKFARFPWEVPQLEAETTAYQWIQGQQIGPSFLGHLTEEGRVIGIVMARIANCRHATPDDFAVCHQALSKLHRIGIKHGDINKHNFLVHAGRATLIDFDNASRTTSSNELEAEMRSLQEQLSDMSGRGGRVIEMNTS